MNRMFRSMVKHRLNRRGFTTAELLVVVAIISVLLALAAPNLVQSWKNLQITELDGTARGIFLAAQNELTDKKASGGLQQLAADSSVVQEEEVTQGGVIKTLYYITSETTGDSLDRLSVLFSTLPGGSVLYLNPRSGDVTDVYYSKSALDHDTVKNLREQLTGTDDREVRAKLGIGYYGGLTASSPESSRPDEPQHLPETLELVNGEDLYLKLVYPELGEALGHPEKVLASISLTDEHGTTVTRNADGDSAVKSDSESDTEFNQWKSSIYADVNTGNDYTLHVLLDSMTDGNSFLKLFPSLKAGDNITVSVSLAYNGKSLYQNAAVGTVNSLFAAKYDTNVTADGIVHKKGVEFFRVRHLSNLRYYSMGAGSAVQTADIDFTRSVRQNTMMPIPAHRDAAPALFPPVDLTVASTQNGLTVDGKDSDGIVHTLRNFQVQSQTAGIFGTCSVAASFQNLRLVDLKGSGEQVSGALIGSLGSDNGSVAVENCGVYQSAAGAGSVAGGRGSGSGAERPTGGLIGSVQAKNGNGITIKTSFSALPVSNAAGQTGGLIGSVSGGSASAPVTIQNSYASVTVISGSSGTYLKTAGGLIGAVSGYVAITDSFSSADAAASEACGALVGLNTGTLTVASSYACGTVTTNGTVTYGPLVIGSGGVTYAGSSYLSQSGNSGAADAYGGSAPSGVTALEYDELAKDSAGNPIQNSAAKCHPYADSLQGSVYPFRMVTDEYYGDWPEKFTHAAGKPPYSLCYYEKYTDNTWGFYGYDTNGTLADTLDYVNAKTIAQAGYGLLVPSGTGKPAAPHISWKSGATLGDKITISAIAQDLYPLPYAKSEMLNHDNQINIIIKDDQSGRDLYVNPLFAAAISFHELQFSEEQPGQLRTEEQLRHRKRISNGWYFKQTHHITVVQADTGGINNNATQSVYDGAGNTVSGLQMPLFQDNNGIIKGVRLADVSISQSGNTAALIANKNTGSVVDCRLLSGSVTSTSASVAGLVWELNTGSISNCVVGSPDMQRSVTITGNGGFASGLVGTGGTGLSISGCRVANTAISNSSGTAAGLMGWGSSKISSCTISADVAVTGGIAAGIAGTSSWGGAISGSAMLGTVTSLKDSGGAAGLVYTNSGGNISGSYSAGTITAQNGGNASGVIDTHSGGNVDHSYRTGPVVTSGSGTASGFVRVMSNGTVSDSHVEGTVTAGGSGNASGFADQLTGGTIGSSYVLGPVTAEGNGTVSGFLRVMSNGTVSGSHAEGAVTAQGGGSASGFADQLTGGTVDSSYHVGSVTTKGAGTAAGFVRTMSNSVITGSHAEGAVTAQGGGNASGFADTVTGGTLDSSYCLGPVLASGGGTASGFVRMLSGWTKFAENFSAGNVTAQNGGIATGFVDIIDGVKVESSYHTGAVSASGSSMASGFTRRLSNWGEISNSFTVGSAAAESGVSVGFVGDILSNNGRVTNCYAAVQLTGSGLRWGFAPVPSINAVNTCYWVRQFGGFNTDVDPSTNVEGRVASISFDTLRQLQTVAGGWNWDSGDLSWTMITTPAQTHPVSGSLSGLAYPYPRIKGLEYYGDWPVG